MSESQSQSQSHFEDGLPAAKLMVAMETTAQRRSMDGSFNLPSFPHMAWVNPSALPNDGNYALAKSPTLKRGDFKNFGAEVLNNFLRKLAMLMGK